MPQHDQVGEDHYTEPYTSNNLTGNNIVWEINEGYFASFANNSSRLMESIIRFPSNETAQQNIELYKPYLLNTSTDFSEEQMAKIGDKSFLIKGEQIIKGNTTPVYLLSFTIRNVLVSLQGFGFEKNQVINYSEIIENNMNNYLSSKDS
jgi:hypothetical protein